MNTKEIKQTIFYLIIVVLVLASCFHFINGYLKRTAATKLRPTVRMVEPVGNSEQLTARCSVCGMQHIDERFWIQHMENCTFREEE